MHRDLVVSRTESETDRRGLAEIEEASGRHKLEKRTTQAGIPQRRVAWTTCRQNLVFVRVEAGTNSRLVGKNKALATFYEIKHHLREVRSKRSTTLARGALSGG